MPYVQVWIDDADMTEFEDSDLIEEIERRGYKVGGKGSLIALDGIDRIEHLVLCGLTNEARTEALQLVETHIGRPRCLVN